MLDMSVVTLLKQPDDLQLNILTDQKGEIVVLAC